MSKQKGNSQKEIASQAAMTVKDSNIQKSAKRAIPPVISQKKTLAPTFPWYALIAIAAVTFLVYIQTVKHEFVNWDDDRYLFDVPQLTAFTWANVKYFFTNYHFVMYLPITMLSYMLDYKFGTLANPGIYHFSNTVYHTINTALVFIFIYRLKMKYSSAETSRNYALIVASLFGLISLHVESVAWVAERKDLLYTLFYISTLITYVKYVDASKSKFYILSLFLFLLSLISKAQAMPLVFMLIGIDLLLQRQAFNKKILLEKIPFLLMGALFGYLAIGGNRSEGTEGLIDIPFLQRMVYACYGFTTYIIKIFVPYKLSVIYPYPVDYKAGVPIFYFFYIIPVLALIFTFFASLKKVISGDPISTEKTSDKTDFGFAIFNREILFGIIFFTFNIVIVLQAFSYHNFIMADRYSYVSSIGVFFILAGFIHFVIEKKWINGKLIWLIFALFIVAQSVNTYYRIGDWKDSITLWNNTRANYPDVLVAWYNCGNVKAEKKDLEGAIADYNEAIKRNPDHVGALSNRGVTFGKLGNAAAALNDFNKLARLDSLYNNVFSNRGNVKVLQKDFKGALQDYNKAIQIKPDYVDALYNRGLVNNTLGNWKAAILDFKETTRLSPKFPLLHLNMGISYANLGQWTEAMQEYNIELSSGNQELNVYYGRAFAFFNLKDYAAAISDYNKVIKEIKNNSISYYYRGLSKYNLQMKTEACADFQQAAQLGDEMAKVALLRFCK